MKRIYVVGTADTKGEELAYLAERVTAAGGEPLLVDVGIRAPQCAVDVAAGAVAAFHPRGAGTVLSAL
ncbi:MAG TPA: Tm-1-like ATP-binding domain-containing protein, partial [Rhizobiaceae bacterium]